MILEIVKYPDPRLGIISNPIAAITPEIKTLARDMIETMYQAEGVGLAAPQIGKNIRMLVMDPYWHDQEKSPRVIINPVLELSGDVTVSEREGCLSVPLGFRSEVPRFTKVHLKGQDCEGKQLDEVLEGFPSIVLQHETDHLDGKLFIDRISRLKRNMYDVRVKKWLKGQV